MDRRSRITRKKMAFQSRAGPARPGAFASPLIRAPVLLLVVRSPRPHEPNPPPLLFHHAGDVQTASSNASTKPTRTRGGHPR